MAHDHPHDGHAGQAHKHHHGHGGDCGHGHGAAAHPQQHGHSHRHAGHGHGHHHGGPQQHGRAFLVAIALNAVFVALEFGYGFIANSTALMADAGHNLSDVLGLALAWSAVLLARRPPSDRYTYGLGGSSILAALGNAVLLFVACGAIGLEAVQRLLQPPAVASGTVTWVAAVGIAVNGFSAWLFAKGGKGDLNVRGAYLHMVADAAVSLGVVVAGVAMSYSGWYLLDPLASLLIVAVILWGTWGLLRESLQLALGAVPPHVDTAAVAHYLRQVPGVADVHHLHVWALSTTESALTAHLVMPQGHPGDAALGDIARALGEEFSVRHSTLQVELAGQACGPRCAPAAAGSGH